MNHEIYSSASPQARLTETQVRAQAAIADPRVLDIAREPAAFGLGICMPHMRAAALDFADLPADTARIERGRVVTFEPAARAVEPGVIPVAWRWRDLGVAAAAGRTARSNIATRMSPGTPSSKATPVCPAEARLRLDPITHSNTLL